MREIWVLTAVPALLHSIALRGCGATGGTVDLPPEISTSCNWSSLVI
jgi:hypothetical protein